MKSTDILAEHCISNCVGGEVCCYLNFCDCYSLMVKFAKGSKAIYLFLLGYLNFAVQSIIAALDLGYTRVSIVELFGIAETTNNHESLYYNHSKQYLFMEHFTESKHYNCVRKFPDCTTSSIH